MRNLVLDNGNSRLKYALFEQGRIRDQGFVPAPTVPEIVALATNLQPENTILSSVAREWGEELANAISVGMQFFELTAQTPLPIQHVYQTPASLGKDRLAAVVGAWHLYPGEDCLVVDAGTCITFDLLTADGVFRGGNIAPGVRMRLRAMHEYTVRLPLVEPLATGKLLGEQTTEALQNGGPLGAALELEGLYMRLRENYPHLRVLLTGGDAPLLANLLKTKIFVHENLVLQGLNQILEYNVEQLA
ncbi:MAG: type III pantothenate kinase [Lewinella sp.]|nr:type III pantothenate kinase [Lewinella sp.]